MSIEDDIIAEMNRIAMDGEDPVDLSGVVTSVPPPMGASSTIDPARPNLTSDEWDTLQAVLGSPGGDYSQILTDASSATLCDALLVMQDDLATLKNVIGAFDEVTFADSWDAFHAKYTPARMSEKLVKSVLSHAVESGWDIPIRKAVASGYDVLGVSWKYKEPIYAEIDENNIINVMKGHAKPKIKGYTEKEASGADMLLTCRRTPLMSAAMDIGAMARASKESLFFSAVFAFDTQNADLMNKWLTAGGNPNMPDPQQVGRLLSHEIIYRAVEKDIPVLLSLSNHGIDWNIGDEKGTVPIQRAVLMGHIEVARCLAAHGASTQISSPMYGNLMETAVEGKRRSEERAIRQDLEWTEIQENIAEIAKTDPEKAKKLSEKYSEKPVPAVYPDEMMVFMASVPQGMPGPTYRGAGQMTQKSLDVLAANLTPVEIDLGFDFD